jgi:hypothetical protein
MNSRPKLQSLGDVFMLYCSIGHATPFHVEKTDQLLSPCFKKAEAVEAGSDFAQIPDIRQYLV